MGELVPGELPLWKQPPTQDEDDQDDLLKDPGPLLRLKSDLQVDVKDRLQALLLLGEDAVTSFLHKNSNSNIFEFIFVEIYCCYEPAKCVCFCTPGLPPPSHTASSANTK